jgi:hypothetical protein
MQCSTIRKKTKCRSYELVPFWGTNVTLENTTFPSNKDNPQDKSFEENVAVMTMNGDSVEETVGAMDTVCDYVGSSIASGIAEEWLLDSGATCGVTYDKTLMPDLKPSNWRITILVGNGVKVATESQGTVTLMNANGQKIKLTGLYYAPSTFTKNIVSMAKLSHPR